MTLSWPDIMTVFSPLGWIAGGILLLFLIAALLNDDRGTRAARLCAALSLLFALAHYFDHWQNNLTLATASLYANRFNSFLGIIVVLASLLTTLFSPSFLKKHRALHQAEFYLLILLATFGLLLMTVSFHLLYLLIGLETASLSFYILIALRDRHPFANEASLKYFILGGIGSAFFLFGSAFFYAATQSVTLTALSGNSFNVAQLSYLNLSFLFIVAGLLFKLALFPFYVWLPDIYQGASTVVAGWMAVVVKTAVVGVLFTVVQLFTLWIDHLFPLLALCTVASLIIGNFLAVKQSYLKRLLACSSMSHAAYLLLVIAASAHGAQWDKVATGPLLYYLLSYMVMTLGAFFAVGLAAPESDDLDLSQLKGLGKTNPRLAVYLSVFLIGLAGLPPTAGFLAKYTVLAYALHRGVYGIAGIAILTTMVGLVYYLKPIAVMYFESPPADAPSAAPQPQTAMALFVLTFLAVAMVVLGLFPQSYLKWSMFSQ